MDINILKNPVVLAVIAAVLTYLYLQWKKKTDKKEEEISLMTPAVVGLMTLFVGYSIFGNDSPLLQTNNESLPQSLPKDGALDDVGKLIENTNMPIQKQLMGGSNDIFDTNTYHLVGRNAIKLPQTDVFIDIAKF